MYSIGAGAEEPYPPSEPADPADPGAPGAPGWPGVPISWFLKEILVLFYDDETKNCLKISFYNN